MSDYKTARQLQESQLANPADYRTSYDKQYNNFYNKKSYAAKTAETMHHKDASAGLVDVSENYVENYYNTAAELYKKSMAPPGDHRTPHDKQFNNFYNKKSFNARTAETHHKDASGNMVDPSGNPMN
tara:strand:+ start:60 stop:440 length:381 start_codon:yes stop_codon:yes gene_type:complete